MHRIEPETHLPARPTLPSTAPAPSSPSSRPARSRAALNLPGLCPVCGDPAQRRITTSPQEARETYRCNLDGETVYLTTSSGRFIQLPGETRAKQIEQMVPTPQTAGVRSNLGSMVPMIQAAV